MKKTFYHGLIVATYIFTLSFTAETSFASKQKPTKYNKSSRNESANINNQYANKDNQPQNLNKTSQSNFDLYNGKNFFVGLNGGFQQSMLEMDTPAAHSILKWRDLRGYHGGVDFGLKLSDNIDAVFSYSHAQLEGEGTDDDIQNALGVFSVQKARGYTNDFRGSFNFNVLPQTNSWTVAPRLGYFHKYAKLGMYDGTVVSANPGIGTGLGNISGLGQETRSTFEGGSVGVKIAKSSTDARNSLTLDFYPMAFYRSNQFWPQQVPAKQRWELSSNNDASSIGKNYGFMVRFDHDFKIDRNFNMKIYSQYERIIVKDLTESGSNYSFSNSNGLVQWDSFMMGVGLYY